MDSWICTNLGLHLANSLIHLANCVKDRIERKQYAITTRYDEAGRIVKEELEKGSRYIDQIVCEGWVTLIFEGKPKDTSD